MNLFGQTQEILEVTLRDGSYLINFQFTADDTATIASTLESVGFSWIEIGHGLGLNASNAGKGQAAASDEEYLEAAANAIKKARWGMFFIPGIGRIEDLRLAARYGMSFVRLGSNITEIDQARPFIELAKELGFIVTLNAMKSYAVPADEFGEKAALVRYWGADIFYLVDSAGCMFPDDITSYFRAAQSTSDIALGFHGHDNLSLAMANTLRALDCGAVLVDSSLQGMGRSAGNSATEILLAIMQQRGLETNIDLKSTMDIGQGLIQPLMKKSGVDPMAVIAGYARFHSSFTPKLRQYASKYQLDIRDLIVRLCQEDLISAPDNLLEQLGKELAADRLPRVISIPAFELAASKELKGAEGLRHLIKELRPKAVKAGKYSTINIVVGESPQDELIVSPNIQATKSHIVGSLTLTTDDQLETSLSIVDGKVDVVFLDVDNKPFGPRNPATTAFNILKKSLLLTYLDSRVWVEAVEDQVIRILNENINNLQLVIAGDHPKSRFLALRFAERRASVTVLDTDNDMRGRDFKVSLDNLSFQPSNHNVRFLAPDASETAKCLRAAKAIVVWPREKPWFSAREASYLTTGTYVIDAGIGSLLPEGIDRARENGARLLRVNIWPRLSAALASAHESAIVCREDLGWQKIADIPVVAGGAMGQRGDVIVDSINRPTRVIGIANGRGGIEYHYSEEDAQNVHSVTEAIKRRLIMPGIVDED